MSPHAAPSDFKSTPEINRKYMAVRSKYIKLLKAKARIASAGGLLDYEDILQEQEIAMLYAVATFDPTKAKKSNPDKALMSWIGWIADNVVKAHFTHVMTQSRMPRVWERDGDGWSERMVSPTSMYQSLGDDGEAIQPLINAAIFDYGDPEVVLMEAGGQEKSRQVRIKFRRMVDSRVDGLASELFWAKLDPPMDLLVFIRNRTGRSPQSPSDIKLTHFSSFHGHDLKAVRQAHEKVKETAREVIAAFNPEQAQMLFGERACLS